MYQMIDPVNILTRQSNDKCKDQIGTSSEHSVDPESEISSVPPEVYVSTPITTNEKGVSDPKSKENAMMERELGEGYSFTKKKCFVCGSLSHLIKDCDYYEKKMAREAEFKKQRVFNTGIGRQNQYGDYANRVIHANQLFLTRTTGMVVGQMPNSVSPKCNIRSNLFNTGRTNVNPISLREPKKISEASKEDSSVPSYARGVVTEIKEMKEEWLSEIRQDWWPKGIRRKKDKYVAEILKKFDLVNVKTAITPMETKVALTKDEEAVDVDVHLYRSMIGPLKYIRIAMDFRDVRQVKENTQMWHQSQPSSSTIPVPSTSLPPEQSPPPITAPIPASTPTPIPETDPEPMEHTFEEPSPAHQHFSPPQEHAQGQMTVDDLLQLVPQLMTRRAHVQFEAQHYTYEDWILLGAKIEANAELSKSVLGSGLQGEDFAKKMVELVNQRKKHFAEERARAKRNTRHNSNHKIKLRL
ncbi:hypothetical protein Tco_0596032 [Tanacetum coccineum]